MDDYNPNDASFPCAVGISKDDPQDEMGSVATITMKSIHELVWGEKSVFAADKIPSSVTLKKQADLLCRVLFSPAKTADAAPTFQLEGGVKSIGLDLSQLAAKPEKPLFTDVTTDKALFDALESPAAGGNATLMEALVLAILFVNMYGTAEGGNLLRGASNRYTHVDFVKAILKTRTRSADDRMAALLSNEPTRNIFASAMAAWYKFVIKEPSLASIIDALHSVRKQKIAMAHATILAVVERGGSGGLIANVIDFVYTAVQNMASGRFLESMFNTYNHVIDKVASNDERLMVAVASIVAIVAGLIISFQPINFLFWVRGGRLSKWYDHLVLWPYIMRNAAVRKVADTVALSEGPWKWIFRICVYYPVYLMCMPSLLIMNAVVRIQNVRFLCLMLLLPPCISVLASMALRRLFTSTTASPRVNPLAFVALTVSVSYVPYILIRLLQPVLRDWLLGGYGALTMRYMALASGCFATLMAIYMQEVYANMPVTEPTGADARGAQRTDRSQHQSGSASCNAALQDAAWMKQNKVMAVNESFVNARSRQPAARASKPAEGKTARVFGIVKKLAKYLEVLPFRKGPDTGYEWYLNYLTISIGTVCVVAAILAEWHPMATARLRLTE